jgi:uncharacterized protein
MSRWISRVLVALLALVPALAGAQVNAIPPAPHLLVKGHAEGSYIPDRFSIQLQVTVTDMVPELARAKVEAHMQSIFAALKKNGALRDSTRASSLQIQPQNEYRDGRSVFVGTQVSRGVSATFDSLDKMRGFIAQLEAGAEVQVTGTDVWRSDIDQIRLDLRKRAMANSQEAARKIAAAYGLTIKGVYSVSEVAPDFAYGINAGSWGSASAGGVPAPPAPPAVPEAVTVTGSRIPDADLRTGSIKLQQDIYAVYLTSS